MSVLEAARRIRWPAAILAVLLSALILEPTPAAAASGATISGRVTYAGNGRGIPWENVTLYSVHYYGSDKSLWQERITLTDSAGYYSISIAGLPAGEYTMRFGLPYLHPTRAEYWNGRSDDRTSDDFHLDPAVSIPGRNADLIVGPNIPTSRLAGADRFATSAAVAQEYPPFEPGSGVVFVVSGVDYPDALSAAPVAAMYGAPLLLTAPDALPDVIRREIVRLGPEAIVVVGGPGVVTPPVYDGLAGLAPEIFRVFGADRYETSREVAERFYTPGVESVFVATGSGFADALTAAPVAGRKGVPVVLVKGSLGVLDQATIDTLEYLSPGAVNVVGGTGAVSRGVEEALSRLDSVTTVTRLGGVDRYDTASWVNNFERQTADTDTVFLALGSGFADALAGAALAGTMGAPLYLSFGHCVPSYTWVNFEMHHAQEAILLGGPGALDSAVMNLRGCLPGTIAAG
ncbi:MAG TPA: cell wall-binding repeat-containing protein [Terrimesophilobacter sp.]|uniref:cell wall-binding repeat-containing protein n=1 Tax=Terrimesophilobacter sp. TaxID=2906435 RepID=UPI002F935674